MANPFSHESNPFDDDARVPAAAGGNPFQGSGLAPLPPEPASGGGFGDIRLHDDQPAAKGSSKSKSKDTDGLAAKEAELRKREEELKKREDALKATGVLSQVKNWPSKWLPIAHHDIASDIPAENQYYVRYTYWSYLGLLLCFAWNFVCVLLAWFTGANNVGQGAITTIFLIIYAVAGAFLAWWLWYKRLYHAMANDRALTFAWFFLMYVIHIAWCLIATIAPPVFIKGSSLTGFLSFLNILGDNTFVGFCYLAGAILWLLETLWSIWVIKSVYMYFRGSGKQQELKREAARAAVRAAV